MASTVKAKTLRVTLTEDLMLGGSAYSSERKLNILNISDVYKRIVTCVDDLDTTIAVFKSTTAGGPISATNNTIDHDLVKYIRVTNLDDTNPINLSIQIDFGDDDTAANGSFSVIVNAGMSYIMDRATGAVAVEDDGASVQTSLHDVESIVVDPLSETVDVEIFVASV
jgi:hypothetical protein